MARTKYILTEGPIFKKLILFTVPMMIATMLQLLFVTLDKIVLGNFDSANAMGAIGAVTSLIHLIINVFNGLSVGVAIAVAQYFGAGDKKAVNEIVNTSVYAGIFCGFLILAVGILLCEPMLKLMNTPQETFSHASLYLKIYFVGAPSLMLYNYCSAGLRSVGDTFKPMLILVITGIINFGLNLLFVAKFKMGVAGVAWATVISQTISAVWVIIELSRSDEACRITLKTLKPNLYRLWEIVRLGIPAGIQNFVFSIANVTIQSGINSFGDVAVNGNTAASDIEGYMNAMIGAFFNSALTFTGQNVGAKKTERIGKITKTTLLASSVLCVSVCAVIYLLRYQLLGFYADDPEIIAIGIKKLRMLCSFYIFFGIMQVFIGSIRGMGVSVTPMFISLFGICAVRLIYIATVFNSFHTLDVLYACYPVSWIITALLQGVLYFIVKKKTINKIKASLNNPCSQ